MLFSHNTTRSDCLAGFGVLTVRRVRPIEVRGAPAGTRTCVGERSCPAEEDRLTGHEGGPLKSALPQECPEHTHTVF